MGSCSGSSNLALLAGLWRLVTRHRGPSCGVWMVLFVFIAMPLVTHSYNSNLLEGPMTTFVLLATITSLLAVSTDANPRRVGWSVLTGLLLFLALQTKGPVAAFVLVFPVLLAWLQPSTRWDRGVAVSALSLVAAAVAAAVVILPER